MNKKIINHKLTKEHKNTAYKLSEFKRLNIEEKRENYLALEVSMQKFIFKSKQTPTAKLLLIYLLSKIDFSYQHLYIHLPYSEVLEQTEIQRAVVMRILKKLDKEKFLTLLSGKNKILNTEIKTYIFKQPQKFDLSKNHNQTNLVDMTPFFTKFFEVQNDASL